MIGLLRCFKAQQRLGIQMEGANSATTSTAFAMVQQRILDRATVSDEFRSILEQDRLIDHAATDYRLPQNTGRNRYVNVYPYDYNRVPLSDGVDYINASHVTHQSGSDDQIFNYIAAQGPLPSTTEDFWRMALEQRAAAIVMLTNVVERGTTKCARYFPANAGDVLPDLTNLEVKTTDVQTSNNGQLTIRTIKVTDRQTKQSITLQHYHYHAWPDHGTPEEAAPIRKISESLQAAREVAPAPVIVHCSAGIGRTGTFISVDILRHRLSSLSKSAACSAAELADALDLPALVHSLRQQRMGMVQTFDQYAFIYQALYEELEGCRGH